MSDKETSAFELSDEEIAQVSGGQKIPGNSEPVCPRKYTKCTAQHCLNPQCLYLNFYMNTYTCSKNLGNFNISKSPINPDTGVFM